MSVPFAQQTKDRVREALKIDVSSYLESKGYHPVGDSAIYTYYRSPLNGGSRGSFIVDKRTNRWIDYKGESRWDRIISLVMQMEGVQFSEALDILLNDSAERKAFIPDTIVDKEPGVRFVSQENFFCDKLYKYFKLRKINVRTAMKYCKQITVTFPRALHPEWKHRFIGIKNDLGGWELRNKYKKRCVTPKCYTTIGTGPDRYIFEGFMDFLSYLTFHRIDVIDGTVIILHSLSLLSWVKDLLKQPGTNYLYLDNDKAANKKVRELKEAGISFVDKRGSYRIYNDFNNMLRNIIQF